MHREGRNGKQTDKQTDRQADRQADRQTDYADDHDDDDHNDDAKGDYNDNNEHDKYSNTFIRALLSRAIDAFTNTARAPGKNGIIRHEVNCRLLMISFILIANLFIPQRFVNWQNSNHRVLEHTLTAICLQSTKN